MQAMRLAVISAAIGVALASNVAWAARPTAVVPSDPATVLERLPPGYARQRVAPDVVPPVSYASNLLEMSARTGDARLASRAEGILSRYPAASGDRALLMARAFSAQHRHEFDQALVHLDALVKNDPRDAAARASRAQILLVQGKLDRAGADCGALALLDSARGLLCIASISMARGDHAVAVTLLDRWFERPPADPGLQRHAAVLRAEAAARAGDQTAADLWFKKALAMASDDVRTLAPYARYLRASGRPREAVTLLANAPDTDGLHLQSTLAAGEARLPQAAALAAAQARRYALSEQTGVEPELREQAEFLLVHGRDPARALKIALQNFEDQRDVEDIEILRRAARAANRPEALASLEQWARTQRVTLAPLAAQEIR